MWESSWACPSPPPSLGQHHHQALLTPLPKDPQVPLYCYHNLPRYCNSLQTGPQKGTLPLHPKSTPRTICLSNTQRNTYAHTPHKYHSTHPSKPSALLKWIKIFSPYVVCSHLLLQHLSPKLYSLDCSQNALLSGLQIHEVVSHHGASASVVPSAWNTF